MRHFFIVSLLLQTLVISAQEYAVSKIDPALLMNANAVIRSESYEVEVKAVDKMILKTRRAVTVFNKYGDHHPRPGNVYDNDSKIKKQQVVIYDKDGKEVRKIKKRDFEDRSLVSSNDLYSDNRLRFFDYTPIQYPYTLVYESEVHASSTIFIRSWEPISSFLVSVENSEYKLLNSANIPFRFEERNFEGLEIEKKNTQFDLHYIIKDLPAYRRENLSPDLNNFSPLLLVALNEFSLMGVKGKASNWKEFGQWQYENLLKGNNVLPQSTIKKIENLTAGVEDNLEKARIIYDYVQNNTRYISVQLGIGGWEPMPAAEVDKLGYGDCKALTNYTMALLETQGIPSNYAVIYGGEPKNIDPEFASMQGNHVILNLPDKEGDVWLECTSQTKPFDYMGDFTDNRNVLLVKPEGGEIISTTKYSTEENVQEVSGLIQLNPEGGFSAKINRKSAGVPYGNIYEIDRMKQKDQILYYKGACGNLRNLEIENVEFLDNRREKEFTEIIAFSGERLASKAGNRLLLPVNFLLPETVDLPRNENRKLPLEIKRGKLYKDYFEFRLPENFSIEAIPGPVTIEKDFGSYSLAVVIEEKDAAKVLKVERNYRLNEGRWEAREYENYRSFMNKIKALNNQKAVLISTN